VGVGGQRNMVGLICKLASGRVRSGRSTMVGEWDRGWRLKDEFEAKI